VIATSTGNGPQQKTLIIKDPTLRKGFTTIPNAVMSAKGLSMSAKYLYGLLLSFAWQDEECWPGQNKLAEAADCSVKTIEKYLKELRSYELISWKRQGLNRPNIYYINDLGTVDRLINPDLTGCSNPEWKGCSNPELTTCSNQEWKTGSIQEWKGCSNKEYSVEEYSVNKNSCITLSGNTTGQSPAAAQNQEVTIPSNKNHIANLTNEYRNTGVVPKDGDYAFIGRLYRRYGYASVLEGISELGMAMAVEKIDKPLLYLKAIVEGKSNKKVKDSDPARESKKELIKSLYRS